MKKKISRLLIGMMVLCMAAGTALGVPLPASAAEGYTYTVTFYAGNQGTFAGGASKITVSGKAKGSKISFDIGQVSVPSTSPYYVKGIRESGRDNSEAVSPSAFSVTEDVDYVVAYGIKGEQVAYTVHYLDADGNTLSDSRTYYGNVGDKPVVAFLYIEGYQPQAYNLTKTLSANEADNVFNFEYEAVETAATQPAETAEAAAGGGAAANAAGAAAAGGAAAGGAAAGGAAAGGAAANAGAVTEVPDEAVPTTDQPEELVDLDDEETPLANTLIDEEGARRPYPIIIGGSILLALILCAAALWIRKKKKGKEAAVGHKESGLS